MRCCVNAAFHPSRMHEVFAQMRDVLKKDNRVADSDVIKEHQVLMDLPVVFGWIPRPDNLLCIGPKTSSIAFSSLLCSA